MIESLVRTIHMIGALGVGLSILLLILACRQPISREDLAGLKRVYLALFVAGIITATAGVTLWLWVGKPAAFYSGNPVFHVKVSLFALTALMLAWPAWYIFRLAKSPARPEDNTGEIASELRVNALARRLQGATLPLLLLIAALAYLIARGVGFN